MLLSVITRRLLSSLPPHPTPLRLGLRFHLDKTVLAHTTNSATLNTLHSAPDPDTNEIAKLSKSISRTEPISTLNNEYLSLLEQLDDLHAMAGESDDEDEQALILDELGTTTTLIDEIKKPLASKIVDAYTASMANSATDSDETPNECILEIRPGTGGDEAAFFAHDLYDSYQKLCDDEDFDVTTLSYTVSQARGLKEAVLEISAPQYAEMPAYGLLKYESGVHRVQRVPVNDVRIQTSACTVVVLPAPPKTFVSSIDPSDLRMDFYRASGAGGQHVNTTESAVRITHIPTGIVAAIQDERSQHKNKAQALKLIGVRVAAQMREEEEKKAGDVRSKINLSGNRGDRIRTYNFKDDRITDHRVKITVFGCKDLVGEGKIIGEFHEGLEDMGREEIMEGMDEEAKLEGFV